MAVAESDDIPVALRQVGDEDILVFSNTADVPIPSAHWSYGQRYKETLG